MIAAIVLGVVAVGYWVYDYYSGIKKRKMLGNLVRILMFHKIGNEKQFRGFMLAEEREDETLGMFIYLKKYKKAISGVRETDYFPDVEYGKCLHICKYADDDFRVISRLRDGEWYHKVDKNPEDLYVIEKITDPEGNEIQRYKRDSGGQLIIKTDDDGEPIDDFDLVPYNEPLGI